MSALGAVGDRIDGGTVRAFLVGDLLAVLAFLVLGELRHGVNPLAQPAYFAGTAAPFYLGWALVGPVAGAYAGYVREDWRPLAVVTGLAWVGAAVVAQLLRATSLFHGDADPVFFLVTVVTGGVLLLGWRFARMAAS